MSSDIVMMGLVLAGMGLTMTYFYVALRSWRKDSRLERERADALRTLHSERLVKGRPSETRVPVSAPVRNRQAA